MGFGVRGDAYDFVVVAFVVAVLAGGEQVRYATLRLA